MMTDPAMLHTIALSAAATALLIAAAHDVAVRTIPNKVSLAVAAVGLGLNTFDGRIASALFHGGLVFAASFCFWRRGWIGGGDVKLLTAATLLVPPEAVPELVLSTTIVGGILALLYLVLGRVLLDVAAPRPTGVFGRVWRTERRRIQRGTSLPYGCAISAGALLTVWFPSGFG